MNCIFESFQLCEVLTSDGNYTIGYVDGKPAEWEGDMKNLKSGDEYIERQQHSDFNSGNETYWVIDNEWREKMIIDKVYFLAWPDGEQWTQKDLEETMKIFGNQYEVKFELTLNTRDQGYGQEVEYVLIGEDQESIKDFCEEIWDIHHI